MKRPSASPTLTGSSRECIGSAQFVTTVLHQFAESLGNAIDAKDPYTSKHSDDVAEISCFLAVAMGLTKREADIIHVAGHLHDIGKIGVPDLVLKKRGSLTPSEWAAIQKHPQAGADILKPVTALDNIGVVEMVLHHHERYDGKGYPKRLFGTQIPLGARIIAVADTVSAMLQNRPYRSAKNYQKVVEEITRCSGTQFDPRVVEVFRQSASFIEKLVSNEKAVLKRVS
ncbi:HD-GYP domain-containing protein [Pseudodesulfovibrio sediminis]|uniref:HD family phosphohydrolase n=1 Tax=Pseudodesulfovibrio sediminis TaxID=2810563 RepID=A0ABM9SDU5_9BACT|nr:HD-GYP domain-containing protein [Pseudodesulfovibrio sediminis]BCS88484.1 HD family phosphohydrolase [Pseudodesulfovibrio sediminis]